MLRFNSQWKLGVLNIIFERLNCSTHPKRRHCHREDVGNLVERSVYPKYILYNVWNCKGKPTFGFDRIKSHQIPRKSMSINVQNTSSWPMESGRLARIVPRLVIWVIGFEHDLSWSSLDNAMRLRTAAELFHGTNSLGFVQGFVLGVWPRVY